MNKNQKIILTNPQHKVSQSKKRFRVLVSGRRFGKTYLCITEMMKYATQVKKNIWYVAPTFKMAREIVWSKLKQMLSDFNWLDEINETNLSIKIKKTGSMISLKGCDNYDSLRGIGLDFLILDEFADIDEKAWTEVLRASISDTVGDVLMCGSPKGYGNWSYRMYEKGKQEPEWESFQFTTLQGGMVSKEEIEQAKQDIDIRTFRQEFEGTFENYAGAVYYNFHAVDNVVKREIDWKKPLHIGLDFNVDPMSAAVAQIDKDNIHFVDEIIIYSSNTDFLSGAVDQVAYAYKKLGGDVLDIELKSDNIYAAYEEAVLEYSYIVNVHQSKNVLASVLGNTTGTFDHDGALKSGDGLSLSLIHI